MNDTPVKPNRERVRLMFREPCPPDVNRVRRTSTCVIFSLLMLSMAPNLVVFEAGAGEPPSGGTDDRECL